MLLLLLSLFVNYYLVYKCIGFAVGFGLFGDPIIIVLRRWLNNYYPKWMQIFEPKK